MELKATDLRVGNILNYDTSEGDTVTAVIDWQDIKWISEDPKGFNLVHSPIPLTEEWLVKFGFKCEFKSRIHCIYTFNNLHYYIWYLEAKEYADFKGAEIKCKFVHKLQNIIHALSGQEL